jgi:hypothetical protein
MFSYTDKQSEDEEKAPRSSELHLSQRDPLAQSRRVNAPSA